MSNTTESSTVSTNERHAEATKEGILVRIQKYTEMLVLASALLFGGNAVKIKVEDSNAGMREEAQRIKLFLGEGFSALHLVGSDDDENIISIDMIDKNDPENPNYTDTNSTIHVEVVLSGRYDLTFPDGTSQRAKDPKEIAEMVRAWELRSNPPSTVHQ